jgi:hypothetical protein
MSQSPSDPSADPPPDKPSEVSELTPSGRHLRPRTWILVAMAVAGIVAVLVMRSSSFDYRIALARTFYQAVADNDCETLDEILSQEAMLDDRDGWIEQNCPGSFGDRMPDGNIRSTRVAESDPESAVVEVTFGEGDDPRTVHTFLVKEDGEWKIYAWAPDERDMVP